MQTCRLLTSMTEEFNWGSTKKQLQLSGQSRTSTCLPKGLDFLKVCFSGSPARLSDLVAQKDKLKKTTWGKSTEG